MKDTKIQLLKELLSRTAPTADDECIIYSLLQDSEVKEYIALLLNTPKQIVE